MDKVHTVFRKLGMPLGGAAVIPIKSFAKKEEAHAHAKELNESYARLMDCRVVDFANPNQPRDTGLTVRALLAELGITAFGNFPAEAQVVDGPEIVAPPAGLILTGHH